MTTEETMSSSESGSVPEERLVAVGIVARPHGIKGDVRLLPEQDVEEALSEIETYYVKGPQGLIPLRPRRVRWANKYVIIGFHGYRSRSEADRLKNMLLYVDEDDLPALEEGVVYQYAQMGCRLLTPQGELLGTVVGIIDSPAHPILQLESPEGEILFPLVPELVEEIREDGRELVVNPPEGLAEVNRKPVKEEDSAGGE